MQTVLFVLLGLVGLGIVVTIHELGHFLAARALGVEVEAFAVGWGPAFYRWKPGKTEYRLCWLPLGGYCKLKGENYLKQALLDPQSQPQPEPGSFFAASPWRRIIISLAGPFFNLLMAAIVLTALALTGVPQNSPSSRIILASQYEHTTYPADQAGLQSGDIITAINGHPVQNFRDLQTEIGSCGGKPLSFLVNRNGQQLTLTVIPRWNPASSSYLVGVYPWIDPIVASVQRDSPAQIAGIQPGDRVLSFNGHPTPNTRAIVPLLSDRVPSYTLQLERHGKQIDTTIIPDIVNGQPHLGIEYKLPHYPAVPQPWNVAFAQGISQTQMFLGQMLDGLVQLVTGKVDPAKSLSGPLLIAYYVGDVASQGFMSGWGDGVGAVANFLAFISLALFLMNLLPLPALDGGNIVLELIELFRRKPLKPMTLIRFQQVGSVIILALIIFTTYNNVIFLMQPK